MKNEYLDFDDITSNDFQFLKVTSSLLQAKLERLRNKQIDPLEIDPIDLLAYEESLWSSETKSAVQKALVKSPEFQIDWRIAGLPPISTDTFDLFKGGFYAHPCYNMLDIITGKLEVNPLRLWMLMHILLDNIERQDVSFSEMEHLTNMSDSNIRSAKLFLLEKGFVAPDETYHRKSNAPQKYAFKHRRLTTSEEAITRKIPKSGEHFAQAVSSGGSQMIMKTYYHKNIAARILWGHFTKNELQVLMLILRYTQGWFSLVNDWKLYAKHFENYTGLRKEAVEKILKKLEFVRILAAHDLDKGVFCLNENCFVLAKLPGTKNDDKLAGRQAALVAQKVFPEVSFDKLLDDTNDDLISRY